MRHGTLRLRVHGRTVLCLSIVTFAWACAGLHSGAQQPVELAITHAAVLDVRSGIVAPETTVLINRGLITAVLEGETAAPRATRVIDAHGRLLTPGFIDVHSHTHLIFNDSIASGTVERTLVMRPDSIAAYRTVFARAYLPYGVTAVRDVGTDEHYLPMLTSWMRRSSDAPDFFPVGAYLVSTEAGRTPVSFAISVADSAAAAAKVREYYALGLRNVKLYWRLQLSAFRGALLEAQKLSMNVTAHVDQQVMTIDQALDLGLRNVEHVHTFAISVIPESELKPFYQKVPERLGGVTPQTPGLFYLLIPEYWNYLGPADPRVLALIEKLKSYDASCTPTLHLFAQKLGLAYFASRPWDLKESTSGFTAAQRAHALAGYRIMASYAERMFHAGIRLNIGTDAQDPGKAVLSEMLLLHEAGIPMTEVFKIATINGAQDIGQGTLHGSVEAGKRANLILFEGDPLTRPTDLLGGKMVIKDGVVASRTL